jgi:hypothetical protein
MHGYRRNGGDVSVSEMKRMAQAESKAARRSWAVGENSDTEPRTHSAYGAASKAARAYAGAGKTQAEVAKITGCTIQAIQRSCCRLGIDWKTGKPVK